MPLGKMVACAEKLVGICRLRRETHNAPLTIRGANEHGEYRV